jgi:hypothetical protein
MAITAQIMTINRVDNMKSTSAISVQSEAQGITWAQNNIRKYGNNFKKWSVVMLDGVDYRNDYHYRQMWTILYNKVDQTGSLGKTVVFSIGANGFIQGEIVEAKQVWAKKPL